MSVNKQPPKENEAIFIRYYEDIQRLIGQRRLKWILSSKPWEDVSSELEVKIWKQIHKYDQTRPFDRWCNTVITNAIINILRKDLFKISRPCIASSCYGVSCCYNLGDNLCGWTTTGHQDTTCPLYAAWKAKKGHQADIASPLSLESHIDEHHNTPSDFTDIEGKKEVLDKLMLKKLTKADAKLYRLIYIKHWPIEKVMKEVGLKSSVKNKTSLVITKARNRFIKMAKQLMKELDL